MAAALLSGGMAELDERREQVFLADSDVLGWEEREHVSFGGEQDC